MIKDPYIGMPINMGGQCDTVSTVPIQPPEAAPQPPEASPQPPQSGEQPPTENTSGFDAMYLGSLPLAMAYVPMQHWKGVYSLQEGLSRGTIFPELDLPFEGRTILSERNNGRRMR